MRIRRNATTLSTASQNRRTINNYKRRRYYNNAPARVPRLLSVRGNDGVRVKFRVEQAVTTLTSSTVAAVADSWNFQLTHISNISNYTAAWDAYRIDKVTCIIAPISNIVAAGSTLSWAPLFTVIDYDDDVDLASINAAMEYTSCLTHLYNNGPPVVRHLKPRARIGAIQSGETLQGAAQSTDGQWFDCAYTTIPYYGLKAIIKQGTSTNNSSYYFQFIYHVSFKNTH